MNCPPEISEAIIQILHRGILNTRSFAGSKTAARCFIEANHIHNLPHLLTSYSSGKLDYYLDVELREYLRDVPREEISEFEPYWETLQNFRKQNSKD